MIPSNSGRKIIPFRAQSSNDERALVNCEDDIDWVVANLSRLFSAALS